MTRDIAGETILVPVSNNACGLDSIYTLNDMGTLIWKRIDETNRLEDIVAYIAGEYDVTIETLIATLVKMGLVKPSISFEEDFVESIVAASEYIAAMEEVTNKIKGIEQAHTDFQKSGNYSTEALNKLAKEWSRF